MKSRAVEAPSTDAVTTAAIGVLSAPLMFLVHELLGHGVATLVLGGHIVRVTSVNESWTGDVPDLAARAIAAAGIVANLLVGAVALFALRHVAKARAETRFFLWFFGHANVYMGSGYVCAGAIFGFGDVPQVLHGSPFEIAWRIAAATIGLGIFLVARRSAERTLDGWAGNDRRRARARTFSLVPYLAMGVAATLSGFGGPDAYDGDVAWSALATFGASLPFAFSPMALTPSTERAEPLDLRRNPGWIVAGAIAVAVLFIVLAPGVPR